MLKRGWLLFMCLSVGCASGAGDSGSKEDEADAEAGGNGGAGGGEQNQSSADAMDEQVKADAAAPVVPDAASAGGRGGAGGGTTTPRPAPPDGTYYEAPPYALGPDSLGSSSLKRGKLQPILTAKSAIYGDRTFTYRFYMPPGYDPAKPVALLIALDGDVYLSNPQWRTTVVLDALTARQEIPMTLTMFVNPIENARGEQYNGSDDKFARHTIDELLPLAAAQANLVDSPKARAIMGHSSGGLAAFRVGWHRPDKFMRIITHSGSFAAPTQGDVFVNMIASTSPAKAIRVFLQSGTMDINGWLDKNKAMATALAAKGYAHRLVWGDSGHGFEHNGAVLPETMRWAWKDFDPAWNQAQ
ncbi:MAG: alpha/beta hydrolase-fold protein [Deltaproteobacteria bacterium]|nr:alpha/beta hydrolase-fold protein [Deltaproteobacteria bacterium]